MIPPLALLAQLAALAPASGTVYVAQLGTDTVAVEFVDRRADHWIGQVILRTPRTTVQRYTIDLDEQGHPVRFTSWEARPPGAAIDTASPSRVVRFGSDSIRTEVLLRDGSRRRTAIPRASNAIVTLHPYYGYPYSTFDQALTRDPNGRVLQFLVDGRPEAFGAPLGQLPDGRSAIPSLVSATVAQMEGTRWLFERGDSGFTFLDLRETTFKVVVMRGRWVSPDSLALAFLMRDGTPSGLGVASPRVRTEGSVGGASITVAYGQPRLRGRRAFPDIVPPGQVWRLGADLATQLTLSAPVRLGGVDVPAGRYSLHLLPGPEGDQLIVNGVADVWGVLRDPAADLYRIPLRRVDLPAPVEALTIAIVGTAPGGGELRIDWDLTRFALDLGAP